MTEKGEKGAGLPEPVKLSDNLAPTIHDLLRYGYTGISAVFAVAYLKYELADVPKHLNAIGPVGLAAIIPVGAIAYVASRTVFAPAVVFSFELFYTAMVLIQTRIRGWADRLWGEPRAFKRVPGFILGVFSWCLYCERTSRARMRFMYFRDEFKLSFFESELAFQVVRESGRRKTRGVFEAEGLWPSSVQTQFYRQHSELQMIYATALVMLVAGAFGRTFFNGSLPKADHLIGVAIFLSTVGGIADIFVSRRECAEIQDADARQPGCIRGILEDHGLITPDETD